MATACASASAKSGSVSAQSDLKRVIAVGDLHGDYAAYLDILEAAGLIDATLNWVGSDTVLIQAGDITDRGPDSRKIIEHMMGLQKQARKSGGDIKVLIGNHEAMNMTGDLRYVDAGEYQAYVTKDSAAVRDRIYTANQANIEAHYRVTTPGLTATEIRARWNRTMPLGKIEHQRAWHPKGRMGKWTLKNKAVILFQDDIYTHGGLSPAYKGQSLKAINKAVKSALKSQDKDLESILHTQDSPLWYRGYTLKTEIDPAPEQGQPPFRAEEALESVLESFGANTMIVGHTPARGGIRERHNGKLIQIDTGASTYYGGTRSFLRIENGQYFAHDNGNIRRIK